MIVFRRPAHWKSIVSPGSGFSGSTDAPADQGNTANRYGTQYPIARWIEPPFQDLSTLKYVGLLADHGSGIAKVRFILDDGTPVDVTSRTVNDGISAFYCQINPASMSDSELRELRAIVYPVDGPCRVMQGPTFSGNNTPPTTEGVMSFWFASNGNGTLWSGSVYVNSATGNDTTGDGTSGAPYATTMKALRQLKVLKNAAGKGNNASGGTIYVQAGNFTLGTYAFPEVESPTRWVTIRPAPGLTKDDVTLTGSADSAGIRTQRVRLYDIRVTPSSTTQPIRSSVPLNEMSHYLIENCECDWIDPSSAGSAWFDGPRSVWVVNSIVANCINGFTNPYVNLIRGTALDTITADAFSDAGCVCDSSARVVYAANGSHPDVYQLQQADNKNKYLYKLVATDDIDSQGIFQGVGWTVTGIAIDSCNVVRKAGTSWQNFAFGGTWVHAVVRDTIGSDNASATPTSTTDCLIENCTNANTAGPLLVAGDTGTVPFLGASGIKYE